MKLFTSQQNILRNVPAETSQDIATFSFNVIKCRHAYTHGVSQNKRVSPPSCLFHLHLHPFYTAGAVSTYDYVCFCFF